MMCGKMKKQAGYTLIELSIVLLVIGLFFAGLSKAYQLYVMEQRTEKTEFKRLIIDFALNDFKKRYGRYPCPASYTLNRTNLQYGYESDCADVSVAPGNCVNGVCIEQSVRQVPLEDGSLVYPRVRRGAIPFRVLNLTESDAYDEYGGRFSYAVTELLTNWQTFDVRNGGIGIIDGQAPSEESMVNPAGSGLYFVFSHGPDLMGAYNESGALISACAGPMFDIENCNTAEDAAATYRYSTHSEMLVEEGGNSLPLARVPAPARPLASMSTHTTMILSYTRP